MNSIRLVCECGKEYRVTARHAGRKAKCRACGRALQIMAIPARTESVDGQIDDWLMGSKEDRLRSAVERGRLGEVRPLLDRGADPNFRSKSSPRTMLILAVKSQDPHIVRALIQAGADVNAAVIPDERSELETALLWAVKVGSLEICRVLLEAGADPNLAVPLVTAAADKRIDLARLLIEKGAGLELDTLMRAAFDLDDMGMFTFLLEAGVRPRQDELAWMLVRAAQAGNLAATKTLLDAGGSPNATDAAGTPVLYHAVDGLHVEVIRLLLKAEANADIRCPVTKMTALQAAEKHQHQRITELLAAAGAK